MKNIVKLFVMTALALLLAISCASAASDNPNKLLPTPPIPGGAITGQFWEPRYKDGVLHHYHQGLDIGIENVEIRAPVDGTVYHGSNKSFGEGWVYFISDDDAYPVKLRMFVGDLDAWTGSQPAGPTKVKQGEKIGYVHGYTTESGSTGAHPHIQFYNRDPESNYAPFPVVYEEENETKTFGITMLLHPGPILTSLGVDLTGAVDYSGPGGSGIYGNDVGNNKYLTISAMEYFGSFLNKIVKEWTDVAANSIVNITPMRYLCFLCFVLLIWHCQCFWAVFPPLIRISSL